MGSLSSRLEAESCGFGIGHALLMQEAAARIEALEKALRPFHAAYLAYTGVCRNWVGSGETSAERRFSEGERVDTAKEAAFEALTSITFEQLCAVNEALLNEMDGAASDSGAEGWVAWDGGECPLPDDTPNQVRFRDGFESRPDDRPQTWNWHHSGADSDIIAYLVVQS